MTNPSSMALPEPTSLTPAMKSRDGSGQQPTAGILQKSEEKNPKRGKRGRRKPASPLQVLHIPVTSHREVPDHPARPPFDPTDTM
ncbi:hypothetical protein U1763_20745 [Sphingomonas sp. LB2R24]|uniref:hypothetical protein n=1 Tax=Sphingomonas sorbitolis TaxID=3096165 RepID=UPI002FCA5A41